MTTHCYHTTASGHKLHITVTGEGGPVLLTFHGGGIVNGSRRDEHIPRPIKDSWPGVIVAVDYRLLVPSTGRDIVEDMSALFDYIPTLPIEHHQLFLAGFSGGGYPLRLSAIVAAKEAQKAKPRFTVLGWVSYFGMGGDLLLDYWLTPRGTNKRPLDTSRLGEEQAYLRSLAQKWYDSTEEISDSPYTDGMSGVRADRNHIWNYWHASGSIDDSITGDDGFSKHMAGLPYGERKAAIPTDLHPVFPQIYLAERASTLPPLLLIHGDNDETVPYEESLNTLRAIQAGGGQAELITIPGADHGLSIDGKLAPGVEEAYTRTTKFMLDRLKAATST